jgi:hypothetical protein
MPSLAPGLYELAITGSGQGSAGTAWLFVSTSAQYRDAIRTFSELRRVDAHAAADVREAGRALARGYMTILDDEAQPR